MRHAMESLFHLQERGTTLAREARGGLTTFLTMAYILFANPSVLGGAGIGLNAVDAFQLTASTCSWQAAMGLVVAAAGLVVAGFLAS